MSVPFPGRCTNGTEAVGCGPQEEFRACADVTITTADGSADSTINDLVDPEIYVPREEDDRYNEVDFDENEGYDQLEGEAVVIESVVFIVIGSILVVSLFFGKYERFFACLIDLLMSLICD